MLTGYILAYEFSMQGDSDITNRRIQGRASMSKLKSDFKKYLSESEQHLRELREDHLKKSKEQFDKLDSQTKKQYDSFDGWFKDLEVDTWPTWFENSKKSLTDLKEIYSKHLMLQEPAEFLVKKSN